MDPMSVYGRMTDGLLLRILREHVRSQTAYGRLFKRPTRRQRRLDRLRGRGFQMAYRPFPPNAQSRRNSRRRGFAVYPAGGLAITCVVIDDPYVP